MNNKEIFNKYETLLKEWQTKMNLVAPSTLTDIQTRHFDDCIQLADILPQNANIIDLGSGAGFPSVVLAILGWNVVATESITKKTSFLNALKEELNLDNLTIYNGRVEQYLKNFKQTKPETIFTARAFASLLKILDYTAHTKCRLFLLKGREIESEIAVAKEKYSFDFELTPSKTGDGFIISVWNIK